VLDAPVARARSADATNLGAGILAAWAAGWFSTAEEAAANMTAITETFTPRPTEANQYDQLYQEVYVGLFPAVRVAMDRLTALSTTATA
jgi:xylulokinase